MWTVFCPNIGKFSFCTVLFNSQVFESHSCFSLCLDFLVAVNCVRFLLTFNGNTKSNIKRATPPTQEITFSYRFFSSKLTHKVRFKDIQVDNIGVVYGAKRRYTNKQYIFIWVCCFSNVVHYFGQYAYIDYIPTLPKTSHKDHIVHEIGAEMTIVWLKVFRV